MLLLEYKHHQLLTVLKNCNYCSDIVLRLTSGLDVLITKLIEMCNKMNCWQHIQRSFPIFDSCCHFSTITVHLIHLAKICFLDVPAILRISLEVRENKLCYCGVTYHCHPSSSPTCTGYPKSQDRASNYCSS